MKIIEQSHEIISLPDNLLGLIETAARNCYKSEDKIGCTSLGTGCYEDAGEKCQEPLCEHHSSHNFVKILRDRGHHAMLEFADITVRFITNRGVTHELVRHRLCSFCLSGETEIISHKAKAGYPTKKWTLAQLFDWQTDLKRKGRIKLIRLRSVDDNGVIVPGRIKRIIKSGCKKTYEVTTESGRKIRSTMKHRFLTPSGWKRLEEINIGDRVIANGMPAHENREWLKEKYIQENNTLEEMADIMGCCASTVTKILRSHGINKPLSLRKNRQPGHGNVGMFSDKQRAQISVRMSGENNHRWKDKDAVPQSGRSRANRHNPVEVKKCWGCDTDSKLEMHHMDGDPINNEPGNIKVLCQKCHKAFHFGQNVLTVFSDKITNISEYGYEETYDLEMVENPHNFVANGLVVHNSQESTRYVRYDWGMEFIRPVWCSEDILGEYTTGVIEAIYTDKRLGRDLPTIRFLKAIAMAEVDYHMLVADGWRPEQAREVLPNSLKTEIVVKANIREWRHIFELRCSKKAHPQMRALILPLLAELKKRVPVVFDDLYDKYIKEE
jgi:thymidylate synthase ThyX